MEDDVQNVRRRSIRKASQSSYIISRNAKTELRMKMRKVSEVLKKPEQDRTAQDKTLVKKNPELVKASQKNARMLQAKKERILEVEDEPELLIKKCGKLADLIRCSKNVVVYTGAGISTAASIPDYRGPNGIWTLLKKGHELCPQDLSDAEPTFTHMSLTKLFKVGKVKHIVSQNCDGLHIRSGFPRHAISEVHGNMYIECCYSCVPHKEFVRLFDVTERTGVHRHTTSRNCRSCGSSLQDTIVHFGEKGKLKSPYRWKEAVRAAKRADLILCLGSSLKVLRKYSCLWCMDKKPQQRPKLVIINLQWTPKDDVATLKINGKCDDVMMNMMTLLDYEVPEYRREVDPIFRLCTPLRASERKTTTKKILIPPQQEAFKSGKRSKNKVGSNSTSLKRNFKLKNSGEKITNIRYHVHLCTKSSLPIEPAPLNPNSFNISGPCVDQLIEKHKINVDKKKSTTGDFTGAAKVYYPQKIDLFKLQDKSAFSEISVLCISPTDSSENIFDFKFHCNQNKDSRELDIQSEIFTSIVPQRSCLAPEPHKLVSQRCQTQENVGNEFNMINYSHKIHQRQSEKCSGIKQVSENCDESITTPQNTNLFEQRNDLDCQNKNTPELVVVNLGKDCSCKWEQRKLDNNSVSSNENVPNSKVVLNLSSLNVDNKISDLLEAKTAVRKQMGNRCENTLPSRILCNLPHILNIISNDRSTDYVNHSCNESFQINLTSKKHFLDIKGETLSMSDNMLLFYAEPVLQQCTRELENCHECNKVTFLTPNETNKLTNQSRNEHNDDLMMLQFQPVLGRLKDIVLDHSYTLTGTSHDQQIRISVGINADEEKSQLNAACAKVDKHTKCSINCCPVIDHVSHSLNSYSTCKQVHSGGCPRIWSCTKDKKSADKTNSLQFTSSVMSMCTSNRGLGNSTLELNPHIQILLEENTQHLPRNFGDQRQVDNVYSLSDVPSSILNMDDIEFVCTKTDTQSELLFDCNDYQVKEYTSAMEPPTVVLPWNCEMLFLPPERTQFELCQERELNMHESHFSTDACHFGLELAHPVKSTVCDSSTIYYNKNHVSYFISNAIDLHDLCADSEVPDIVLLKPNLHSLTDSREQCLDSFRNKNSHMFVKSNEQSSVEGVSTDPSQTLNRSIQFQLKSKFVALQQNMDVKEGKADKKRCHQISQLTYIQNGNNLEDCKNGGRENVCKEKCKRKSALPAVPGWFGKGLLTKKKRKF